MQQLELFEDTRGSDELLREFQDTFQTPNTPEFWIGLAREEAKEVEGAAAELLKEFVDLAYVTQGAINAGATDEQLVSVFPTNPVLLYLFEAFGEDLLEEAFRIVHRNNMSKVQPDGTVKRREDGKVLKPDNYVPVDLTGLIARI